jgi:hypothetical protein
MRLHVDAGLRNSLQQEHDQNEGVENVSQHVGVGEHTTKEVDRDISGTFARIVGKKAGYDYEAPGIRVG